MEMRGPIGEMMRKMLVFLALAASAMSAQAVVGPSTQDGRYAAHAIMILKRSAAKAGYCSGVVIARDIVLTAAHCVADPANLRVHFRDSAGQPVLLKVADVAIHPGFRANAKEARVRTVDLALVRSAEPLPASFVPAVLDETGAVEVGAAFTIAGFGIARENAPETSGTLRTGALTARAPLSKVLLWAKDRDASGTGACTGDSGAPIFDAAGAKVVAITAWADGAGKAFCGKLTQGTLVAPQRGWINEVLLRWGKV